MDRFLLLGLVALLLSSCASSSFNNTAPRADSAAVTSTGSDALLTGEPKQLRTSAFAEGEKYSRDTGEATTPIPVAVGHGPDWSVYRIGPQDLIEIIVFQVPELSLTVQVSERGTLNLPLVGELTIAGKTAREFEEDLTAQLGRTYLRKPQVNVLVKEYNSQSVVVEGAVNRPGVLPLKGPMSLLRAIALSGGMQDISDETVLVFRNTAGRRTGAKFDIGEIQKGTSQDPQLRSGDVVVVSTSEIRRNMNQVLKLLPIAGVFTLL